MVYLIYCIKNKITNKIYIGQTCKKFDKRFKNHLKTAKSGAGFYLHNAIRKYGIENFETTILETVLDFAATNEKEIFWIAHFNSNNSQFGYNLTSGGAGTSGHSVSEETKQKLSALNKGKKLSEETKNKISNTTKGKIPSEETKKKLSIAAQQRQRQSRTGAKNSEAHNEAIKKANAGRVISEETRKKQSIAKLGKKLSAETIEKQRAQRIGKKRPISVGKAISAAKMINLDKEQLLLLWNEYRDKTAIAKIMNCGRGTVRKYLKLYGIC